MYIQWSLTGLDLMYPDMIGNLTTKLFTYAEI